MTRIVAEILADVQEGEEIASQETCERLAGILFQMHISAECIRFEIINEY